MTDLLRPSPPPSWRARAASVLDAARANSRLTGGLALAVVAAGAGAYLFLGRRPAPPPLRLPQATAAPAPAATPTSADVLVHVAGAVARPGVTKLPNGARVNDAVAAAGGTTADADLDQVNLAARVADGDRVYVPRRGEAAPPASGPGGPGTPAKKGPVELNTATLEQLDGLPGVGPSTAQSILDFRTQHGRFRSVDDLLEVRGIGPAKLSTLRPLVTVR